MTALAKWKTTVQFVALAFLIVGPAGEALLPGSITTGIVLLWIAAIAHALHRLGLYEGELRPCRRRLRVA